MCAKIDPQRREQWMITVAVALLLPLLCGTGVWSQEKVQRDTQPRTAKLRSVDVTVQQGRLSVDIQQADIRDVLTQIGEQAGIAVQYHARAEKRISARLMDVELEQGLQRLLRLASLGYAILYVQRPGGDVAMREVRVFDLERGESLPQPSLPAVAESSPLEQAAHPEPPSEHVGQNVVDQLARHLAATPQMPDQERQALVQHFLEALRVDNQEADFTPPTAAPSTPEIQSEGLEISTGGQR
jgi:hypothetical protein